MTQLSFFDKPENKRLNNTYNRILKHCIGLQWFNPEREAKILDIRLDTFNRLLRLTRSQGWILDKRNNGNGFFEYRLIEQALVMGSFDKNGDSIW